MRTWSLPSLVLCLLLMLAGLVAARDEKLDAVKKERQKLAGTWQALSYELDGKAASPDDLKKVQLLFDADGQATAQNDGQTFLASTTTLDPARTPKTIDIRFTEGEIKGQTALGIYKVEGDILTICRAAPGKDRPAAFASKPGSGHTLMTYQRLK